MRRGSNHSLRLSGRALACVLATSFALLSAASLAATPAPAVAAPGAARPRELEVHFIDVGQGDGILVRSPSGKTILIDAGNTEAGPVVDAYLTKLGVGAIDLAIVSHPHLDHLGGMLEVLKKHRPAAYVDPGYAHPLEQYDELMDWLATERIPVRTGRQGRTITIEPGITLELLAPQDPLLSGTRSDANSNSVVARLVYGTKSFLFTGDSEDETENRVGLSGQELRSTVLKVAHHGGRYSTSNGWLGRVEPEFAVISCGNINGYKHPTPETLGRLEVRGTRTYRTDLDGDVIARTDGKTLRWETTGEASAKLDEKGGRRSFDRDGRSRREPRTASAEPKGPIDLNSATATEIEQLPGVGRATARLIVENRLKNGPFSDIDAVMRVHGVGRGTVDRFRAMVVTSKVPTAPVVDDESTAPRPTITSAPAPVLVPEATSGGAAPRPMVKAGLAFRTTARMANQPAEGPFETDVGGLRLLAAPGRSRVNLNLAGAEAIARAASITMERARLVVDDRAAKGPFHLITDLARVKGLGASERAALFGACSVRIELNGATQADLIALGFARNEAAAIVEWRRQSGDFATIDDLEEVDEVPPQKRALILPMLTVETFSAHEK